MDRSLSGSEQGEALRLIGTGLDAGIKARARSDPPAQMPRGLDVLAGEDRVVHRALLSDSGAAAVAGASLRLLAALTGSE